MLRVSWNSNRRCQTNRTTCLLSNLLAFWLSNSSNIQWCRDKEAYSRRSSTRVPLVPNLEEWIRATLKWQLETSRWFHQTIESNLQVLEAKVYLSRMVGRLLTMVHWDNHTKEWTQGTFISNISSLNMQCSSRQLQLLILRCTLMDSSQGRLTPHSISIRRSKPTTLIKTSSKSIMLVCKLRCLVTNWSISSDPMIITSQSRLHRRSSTS